MRLFFITDTLSSGGSERVMSVLANGLSKQHQVTIVCLRGDKSFYEIDDKVNLIFLQSAFNNNWIRKFFWIKNNIDEECMVISFMVSVYIFTLISLLFKHVPIIVSERNDPNAAGFFKKILRRLFIWRSQAIVVQTNEIKKYFPKKLWKKIQIIYNPISSKYVWKSGITAKKSKLIINIGRLSPQKNHKMLIDAFRIFQTAHPEYHLNIYGEGEIHDRIQQYINISGLSDKITLMGRCECLNEVLPHAEIFALSSNYEGMSNALIEAMYVGIPVVTTAVSGTEELIESGRNGLVVPIKDTLAFASAMNNLIENKSLSKQMAVEETNIAFKVNPEVIIRKWEHLIIKVYSNY